MKTVSINEIKQELQHVSATEITELCLRLARFKKENKELLSYLIFDAHDIASYTNELKQRIDDMFKDVNRQNIYLAKKTLRKILREINKQSRITLNKQTDAELRIHFATALKNTGIDIHKNKALENMFAQQIKKAKTALAGLHEDIQYDYKKQLEKIEKSGAN